MCPTNEATCGRKVDPLVFTPVSRVSWSTIMMRATPAMYPISTGRESRSATKPSRRAQAAVHSSPTTTASAAASTAYRAGSAAASGPTAAAVMSAVVDSGPTDSSLDVPNPM